MPYLRCARCALQFKIQPQFMRVENCPRCLARSAVVVPLTLSADRVAPVVGWGPPCDTPDEAQRSERDHARWLQDESRRPS